jgi:hypothetical protein
MTCNDPGNFQLADPVSPRATAADPGSLGLEHGPGQRETQACRIIRVADELRVFFRPISSPSPSSSPSRIVRIVNLGCPEESALVIDRRRACARW